MIDEDGNQERHCHRRYEDPYEILEREPVEEGLELLAFPEISAQEA